jgi:hypothetical protein
VVVFIECLEIKTIDQEASKVIEHLEWRSVCVPPKYFSPRNLVIYFFQPHPENENWDCKEVGDF